MRKQTAKKTASPAKNFPWSSGAKTTEILVTPTKYDNKIEGFLQNVDSVIKQRTNRFGGKDTMAKKLQKAKSSAKGQLRRQNVVCEPMAKSLHRIRTSLKGGNAPKNLKNNYQDLQKFLKNQVQQHTVNYIHIFHKSLKQIAKEIENLQNTVKKQVQVRGAVNFKVDSAIARQLQMLDRRLGQFKTKYTKTLNPLAKAGNRSVESSINQIKKEIDSMRKSIRQSLSLVKKAGSAKKKTGARTKTVISKRDVSSIVAKWKKYEAAMQKHNKDLQLFTEQLKATQKL